jgi:hypothetical protein
VRVSFNYWYVCRSVYALLVVASFFAEPEEGPNWHGMHGSLVPKSSITWPLSFISMLF